MLVLHVGHGGVTSCRVTWTFDTYERSHLLTALTPLGVLEEIPLQLLMLLFLMSCMQCTPGDGDKHFRNVEQAECEDRRSAVCVLMRMLLWMRLCDGDLGLEFDLYRMQLAALPSP